MKKQLWMILGATALVAGCGSSVKLEDVPVESRVGTSVGTGTPGGADASGTAQSRVAPVAVDPTAGQAPGPQGVARTIFFDYDSFVIKPEFQSVIDAHARYLKANNGRRVAVEGHTDERGGREYNLALGQKRSEAVRRALVLLGVSDGQIEAVSFGEEKPAEAGVDESAYAKNRRAEIAYR